MTKRVVIMPLNANPDAPGTPAAANFSACSQVLPAFDLDGDNAIPEFVGALGAASVTDAALAQGSLTPTR